MKEINHTLGILEQLRTESGRLWGASSDAYFRVDELLRELANPNLHDIAGMNHRIELWTVDGHDVRTTVTDCKKR